MIQNAIDSPYKGSGGLTREQFLFYETRTVARLMSDEGLEDKEIIENISKVKDYKELLLYFIKQDNIFN